MTENGEIQTGEHIFFHCELTRQYRPTMKEFMPREKIKNRRFLDDDERKKYDEAIFPEGGSSDDIRYFLWEMDEYPHHLFDELWKFIQQLYTKNVEAHKASMAIWDE